MFVVVSGMYGWDATEVDVAGPFPTHEIAMIEVHRDWTESGFGPEDPPAADGDGVIWGDEHHSYDSAFWRIVELKG
jgi:hypothetical protein